ncbi:hypothetical protein AUJ10_02435 [Candidatus Pacearchaeota archaeon CG1_02_31_27]|nr:MAG: hypothetical protein AUJ10_02435 [Candidatus Pacearchaeota archaeon CG1_02_31_27]PIN92494.1 MAG: ribonuclease P [Candidatus Pacearchaeota archaeon CG10_big_fil_rev_8_21_14_0_10_31_59]PIZ80809.1 MAG: ribonuclease P [Candidatus Pacearchaeota archaeon CG_4_10_14_0_2_um_filter_31_10]
MKKKEDSKEKKQRIILKEIEGMFDVAEDYAKKDMKIAVNNVKKAKRIAMKINLKLPKRLKNKFCKKCYFIFTPENCEIRIKNKRKTIRCKNCGTIKRMCL